MVQDVCILCKEPILKSPDDKEPMCSRHEFIDEIKDSIQKAKKEGWELLEENLNEHNESSNWLEIEIKALEKLKQRHLSTFENKRDIIADKQNPPDIPKITQEGYVKKKSD